MENTNLSFCKYFTFRISDITTYDVSHKATITLSLSLSLTHTHTHTHTYTHSKDRFYKMELHDTIYLGKLSRTMGFRVFSTIFLNFLFAF
jgi:hypothetical protein